MNIVKPAYKPILFRGALVRRIMEGEKTQTRRVITPQPDATGPGVYGDRYAGGPDWGFWMPKPDNRMYSPRTWRCPYGEPGDRLWVRSSFWEYSPPSTNPSNYQIWDEATQVARWKSGEQISGIRPDVRQGGWKRRPSIFMPRWACRLEVEIVKVRVEQLQEITAADIEAEGFRMPATELFPHTNRVHKLRHHFGSGWDKINAKRGFGWDANPWLWVLDFKRVTS